METNIDWKNVKKKLKTYSTEYINNMVESVKNHDISTAIEFIKNVLNPCMIKISIKNPLHDLFYPSYYEEDVCLGDALSRTKDKYYNSEYIFKSYQNIKDYDTGRYEYTYHPRLQYIKITKDDILLITGIPTDFRLSRNLDDLEKYIDKRSRFINRNLHLNKYDVVRYLIKLITGIVIEK